VPGVDTSILDPRGTWRTRPNMTDGGEARRPVRREFRAVRDQVDEGVRQAAPKAAQAQAQPSAAQATTV